MKDVESGISFLKEVRQNVVRGIRARLDALSPEQRLQVVIGMFGILVVLADGDGHCRQERKHEHRD